MPVVHESVGESRNSGAIVLDEQNCIMDSSFILSALQPARTMAGSTLDLADVLSHIAEHIGWVVGATSVRICSWAPERKTSTVLAEYIGPHVSAEEQVSSIKSSGVEKDPMFMEALLVGQPWVEHVDDPDLPVYAQNHLQTRRVQSILYIPLRMQFQVVAYAELCESRRRREFTTEERAVCQFIAQNAAIAIENARLRERLQQEWAERKRVEEALQETNQELEKRVVEHTAQLSKMTADFVREINERKRVETELLQRNRELVSLQSAAAAISASLDLGFVLNTVTWEMVNLLGTEACVISEWNRDADVISTLAEYGAVGWQEEGATPKVHDLADYPFRKRALVERCIRHATISEPDMDSDGFVYMQAAGVKTLLMLPMVFQERVVGLIEVIDSQTERSFTDHQISLAQFLATQTASAIENARLYEQAQREVAERMRAEGKIRRTLKEKEVLLKEIHHRVKNNLQVISSMLSLQSRNAKDQEILEMFQESQNRVRSMALIHERLYRSRDLSRIDFAQYIQDLATRLVYSYSAHSDSVTLTVNADDVFLSVDVAIPCGLILNELLSNALKYAFPDDRAGEIRVEMSSHRNGKLTMSVGDSGVGFPKDLDFRNTETLGLQLVDSLVAQLEGAIELHANGGTEFKITFTAPQ